MPDPRPLALLVQLSIPPPGPQPVRGNVPLAAAYLKLFAQRQRLDATWRIEILPAAVANTHGDRGLVAAILDRRPALVGFTCYLWNIERTLWIAARLKEVRPDVHILLGGPEITADNDWVLRQPQVDYAAIGEGEQTFAALLASRGNGSSSDLIPGLWRRGGPLPPPRAALENLDLVSSPYLEGMLDASDERTLLLETTRGCRYRCKFCYYPKSYDSIFRLSPEQIERILGYACDRGVEEVFLLDPTLNQRPAFDDFLRLLARGNPGRQFTYSAELRAETIGPETARLLAAANFAEVEVGLQSVGAETQRLMGRPVKLEAFERGAQAMIDAGIRVRVDLILGLPGDTVDTVRRGLEYLDRVRPFSELQVFNLSILPGTAFRAQAAELGLEYQSHPPYYVLKTPSLDLEAMYDLMDEAQDVFGIEFDSFPPPDLAPRGPGSQCVVDLDRPLAEQPPPPADARTRAFTLHLRAADFHAVRNEAARLVEQLLADNPHTTLQVVLEPTGDLRRVTPSVLETLLAACHTSLSYLDWFYSLHPTRLLGAKRVIVLAPLAKRSMVGREWLDAVGDRATIVWHGAGDAEDLEEFEYCEGDAG